MTPLALDDYLPYLINRAGVRLVTHFSLQLRAEGLSIQDWRVLAALVEQDGPRLSDLAERTSIEISTLSRVVGSMEESGLLSRTRASSDARAVTIRLAARGSDVAARLIPAARALEAGALAGLSAAEAAQLKALLRQVYDNLDNSQLPTAANGD